MGDGRKWVGGKGQLLEDGQATSSQGGRDRGLIVIIIVIVHISLPILPSTPPSTCPPLVFFRLVDSGGLGIEGSRVVGGGGWEEEGEEGTECSLEIILCCHSLCVN